MAWEPGAAEGPAAREVAPASSVQLTALALDGRPLFRGDVPGSGPTTAGAPGGSVTFDAPPGQLQMRLRVEGEQGQVLDSATRELTVPDYTQVQVSLGTPRIYRARTARDVQVIRSNPATTPTVDREFSRTERLLIRVDGYAPGGVTPTVSGRLLNRSGSSMADIPLTPAGGSTFEAELPLSALAAGEYLIEFNASTDSGKAQDTIAFRINR
jgi:hypothetical protein